MSKPGIDNMAIQPFQGRIMGQFVLAAARHNAKEIIYCCFVPQLRPISQINHRPSVAGQIVPIIIAHVTKRLLSGSPERCVELRTCPKSPEIICV